MPSYRATRHGEVNYVELRDWMNRGLASGRFVYTQGHYLRCTVCGRTGGPAARWMIDCIKGHPYICACGRAFATAHRIHAHRRKSRTPLKCQGLPEEPEYAI